MAHVYYSRILNVSAPSAWEIVRDFGSLPTWFPFVQTSVLRGGGKYEPGTIRANTVSDGSVIEERLLELSDRDRRIVYDIVKADIPTKNYSAVLRIFEVTETPGQCFVEWSADFDVEGDPKAAIEWVRDGIFKTCLEELERVIVIDGGR